MKNTNFGSSLRGTQETTIMNAPRRKQITDLINKIEEVKNTLIDLHGEVGNLLDDEQEHFDNMPEGLQNSDKGEKAQEGISALEEAQDGLSNTYDSLQEVIDQLETAKQ